MTQADRSRNQIAPHFRFFQVSFPPLKGRIESKKWNEITFRISPMAEWNFIFHPRVKIYRENLMCVLKKKKMVKFESEGINI